MTKAQEIEHKIAEIALDLQELANSSVLEQPTRSLSSPRLDRVGETVSKFERRDLRIAFNDAKGKRYTVLQNVSDFDIQANFEIPEVPDRYGWDFGFMFRGNKTAGYQFVLLDCNSKICYLERPIDQRVFQTLGSTQKWSGQIRPDRNINIRFCAKSTTGEIELEGENLESLHLAHAEVAGDLSIVSGLFEANRPIGYVLPIRHIATTQLFR